MNRIKLFTIIVVLLFLINIISLSFILLDFRVIKSPETIVEVNIKNITENKIIIETIITISNPNVFDFSIKDLKISTYTDKGFEVGSLKIKGGDISSSQSKVFSTTDSFSFNGHDFKNLRTKIDGDVGVKIFSLFEKNIPLDITVLTSVEKIFDDLKSPVVNLDVVFEELNYNGINFTSKINFYNPNNFEMYVDNLSIKIENIHGQVGILNIDSDKIKSNGFSIIKSSGSISYDAIDSGKLFLNLTGKAGVRAGGIEQHLDVFAFSSVEMPKISDFIFQNEQIEFILPVQFNFKALGVESSIGFSMYNPSQIELIGENLVCRIYRLDGEDKHLLAEKNMASCEFKPRQRVCVQTKLLVPYWKFFTTGSGQIIPDSLILGIEGDLSIYGTSQRFPISLEAYVDPNILNPSEFDFDE